MFIDTCCQSFSKLHRSGMLPALFRHYAPTERDGWILDGAINISLLGSARASTRQLIPHFSQRHLALGKKNQQVIDEIARFSNQGIAIFILRSDDRLAGFLAKFLQDLIESLLEQIRGVRAFRQFSLARFDDRVKFVENIADRAIPWLFNGIWILMDYLMKA